MSHDTTGVAEPCPTYSLTPAVARTHRVRPRQRRARIARPSNRYVMGPLLTFAARRTCHNAFPSAESNAMKLRDGSPANSRPPAVVRRLAIPPPGPGYV